MFDAETTIADESVDVSAPTVVVSAAPLQPCVRASANTVRQVALSRLPGTALGTVPPARKARMWVIEEPPETAPVGAIPMPGERAHGLEKSVSLRAPMWACGPSTAAVPRVQSRAQHGLDPARSSVVPQSQRAFDPSSAVTRVESRAAATSVLPLGTRAFVPTVYVAPQAQRVFESSSAAPTERGREPAGIAGPTKLVREAARSVVTKVEARTPRAGERSRRADENAHARGVRACEPPVRYTVEREISEVTTRRAARPSNRPKSRRGGHVLVLIVGILAGFLTVLSVVVVRQQRDLRATVAPAQRVAEACAAYADQVRAIALELTRTASDVAAVESRIGERARGVVNDQGMQRLCGAAIASACAPADTACVAAAVMKLRQALARR